MNRKDSDTENKDSAPTEVDSKPQSARQNVVLPQVGIPTSSLVSEFLSAYNWIPKFADQLAPFRIDAAQQLVHAFQNPAINEISNELASMASAFSQEIAKNLEAFHVQAVSDLQTATTITELRDWYKEFLAPAGLIGLVSKKLPNAPVEDRPPLGRALKASKAELQEIYDAMFENAERDALEARLADELIDVTLPGRAPITGTIHPVSQMIEELSDIFALLGFQTVFGREIETGRYNFDLLNIPSDHPARDVWDTIIVDAPGEIVLRTHTSPMQARVMEASEPPIRVIVPGRAYRYEAQDASHEWMFHQLEGLAVDENITMADLKGVLQELGRQLFGPERRVRFRCDFFPFVEPGVDFAVDCAICNGKGCRTCKHTGWLEMGGAGMVHPNVLRGVGYDPEKYTGFAFGLGIERMFMMKHGVDDIRAFAGNDLRFLRQFATV